MVTRLRRSHIPGLYSQAEKTRKRKEVKIMKYEKPELVVLGSASDAILGMMKGPGPKDNPEQFPSVSAYEADE